MKIYTDSNTSVDIQVSDGNKWYTYLLPKDKGLYKIEGSSVKKVVVKANITTNESVIIPSSTVEASFKGSNTSNITDMYDMFNGCSNLTSLDLSGWNTSNVTSMSQMFYYCSKLETLDISGWDTSKVKYMNYMFRGCSSLISLDLSGWDTSKLKYMGDMFASCNALQEIKMVGCSQDTIQKITNVKPSGATIVTE